MTQLRDIAVTKRDHFMFAPEILKIETGYNIRDLATADAQAGIEELAASIKENGLRVPLRVRLAGDDVFITQGHRRFAAINLLISRGEEIQSIECLAEPKHFNDADRTLDLFLSNDGAPLTEMEKAEIVRRLLNMGWDQGKIAGRMGKSQSYVSHLQGLLAMPEAAQQMVRDGEVSATAALNTVRSEGGAEAVATLTEAVASAKASGRKKATTRFVTRATQAREPPEKQVARPLPGYCTEKVSNFLHAIITEKYDGDPEQLLNDAKLLHSVILRAISGVK